MLLSERFKNKFIKLAGITEAFGTGNTSDAEREEAFAKTNERVPYKKDLMISAIKGGMEIGLLFKTKNAKDRMPIAKYRTILPMALGIHKDSGNEVLSAFHKIGQSESKARESGKRSAEAKDEWRLFKTKNILSMWLTGRMFQEAPQGFKGKTDARMSTVEAYFNPITAKRIQAQKAKDNNKKTADRDSMVKRGISSPNSQKTPISKPVVKEPIKKDIAPVKNVKSIPNKAIKQPDIKGKGKSIPVKEPVKKTEPNIVDKGNKKLTTEPVKKNTGRIEPVKPIGYKEKKQDTKKDKDMELNELRNIIRNIILENSNITWYDGTKTIEYPIIPDALEVISQNPKAVKFTDKNQFDEFLNKQKYFSASYSHCYYTMDDLKASWKGDERFRKGSQGVSETDRGCVIKFETGRELVAVWSEKDKLGYVVPGSRSKE